MKRIEVRVAHDENPYYVLEKIKEVLKTIGVDAQIKISDQYWDLERILLITEE